MTRTFGHSPLDYRYMPPAIRFLILSNLVAFAVCWLNGGQMFDLFGLVPAHVVKDRWVWQPITYLFIHGSGWHLFWNLLSIWMFALPVEGQWGAKEFLKYYFICGIGAGLVSVAIQPHSPVPIIGASGAIFGLLVAFAMMFPDAVLYLYFFFPIKARDMAILYGVIEFFAGTASTTPGVARFTHLAGMLIGFVYLRYWDELKIHAKWHWRKLTGGGEDDDARPYSSSKAKKKQPAAPDPMEEVDRILDKISAHGKDSLSAEELEVLRRLSERKDH
ncbi:MAG: rhomboid family intramembrane serine protease [Elusimicrobia bacterium]|nr:rhomboid family intramembrane serine protease [Elusimicrobiota bacterium]